VTATASTHATATAPAPKKKAGDGGTRQTSREQEQEWRGGESRAGVKKQALFVMELVAVTIKVKRLVACGDVEPHPGPTKKQKSENRTFRVLLYNVCGLRAGEKGEGVSGKEKYGTGKDLIRKESEKMKETRKVMDEMSAKVAVLVDTHIGQEELTAIIGMLDNGGWHTYGIPGVRTGTKGILGIGEQYTGGVIIAWRKDGGVTEVPGNRRVVQEGRIAEVRLKMETGREITLIGAYMPQRRGSEVEAKESWEELTVAVVGAGHNVVLAGDLNAEMPEIIKGRKGEKASVTQSDQRMREMVEKGRLHKAGVGMPTQRQGGEIDHILVGTGMAGMATSPPRLVEGPTGDDHKVVVLEMRYTTSIEGRGPARPRGIRVTDITNEEWGKFTEELDTRMDEEDAEKEANKRGRREEYEEAIADVRMLHRLTTEAAGGKTKKEKKKEVKATKKKDAEEREGKTTETEEDGRKKGGAGQGARGARDGGGPVARARWKEAGWLERVWRARRWNGKMGRKREVKGDLFNHKGIKEVADRAEKGERKRAVVEYCEEMLKEATAKLGTLRWEAGEELKKQMKEAASQKGGVTWRVFEAVRRATGKDRGGGVQLESIFKDDKARKRSDGTWEGTIIEGAANVRTEACRIGQKLLGEPKAVSMKAVRELNGWVLGEPVETDVDAYDRAMSWDSFERALSKAADEKAVGSDGWNASLLKRASKRVRTRYWKALKVMADEGRYPEEWKQWIAMLAMKGGEHPARLGRRRDLWLVPHGQKILMRMVNPEYDRVAGEQVPGSQAGFERYRGTTEQTAALRCIRGMAMANGAPLCLMYIDWAGFFMSIIREVQLELEKHTGVHPSVTNVVRALQEDVTGRYETAHGLTDGFEIKQGNGQGCVNGGARSKIPLILVQRILSKIDQGYELTPGPESASVRVAQLWFADDGALLARDMAGLQSMLDACGIVAMITGLEIKVKGKEKTAYSAVEWVKDSRGHWTERDMIGCKLLMHDGTEVPQLRGDMGEKYKHLGTQIPVFWRNGMQAARDHAVARCRAIIQVIGRVEGLTLEQLNETIDIAIAGIIGYYGRATPMRWEDMEKVEQERRKVLKNRGYARSVPRARCYTNTRRGGMEVQHAYVVAAAALVDQVDRMLCGGSGAPARRVIEAAISSTMWRLGCRGMTGDGPIEWQAPHIGDDQLSDECIIEAWLKAKRRAGVAAIRTTAAGEETGGMGKIRPGKGVRGYGAKASTEGRQRGPGIWEHNTVNGVWAQMGTCTYSKRLAAVGIVWWSDVMKKDGGWMTYAEARDRYKIREGDRGEYERMVREVEELVKGNTQIANLWKRMVDQGSDFSTAVGNEEGIGGRGKGDTLVIEGIRAVRKMGEGKKQYLVEWEGGSRTWQAEKDVREWGEERAAAQVVHTSFRDSLKDRQGEDAEAARRACDGSRVEGDMVAVGREYRRYVKDTPGEIHIGTKAHEDTPSRKGEWDMGTGWEVEKCKTAYYGVGGGIDPDTGEKKKKDMGLGGGPAYEGEDGGPVTEKEVDEVVESEGVEGIEYTKTGEDGEVETRWVIEKQPTERPLRHIDLGKTRAWRRYGKEGYEAIDDEAIAADPVLRILQRWDAYETGEKVTMATGQTAEMDTGERKVMNTDGNAGTLQALWVLVPLHIRHHFTYCAATDGSLREKTDGEGHVDRRVAWGLYEGVGKVPRTDRTGHGERIKEAVGKGMRGGRLPDTWEIVDAEMYAIRMALARAIERAEASEEEEGEGKECRVCIVSDSETAIKVMEAAWRKGRVEPGDVRQDRAALVQEVCRLRAKIMKMGRNNRVIAVWCPGHAGIISNAMADAAAKAGLEGEVEMEEICRIAKGAVGRTCMYGTVDKPGEEVTLSQEGLYRLMKGGIRKWVEKEIAKDKDQPDILAGAKTEGIWWEVVKATGKTVALSKDVDAEGVEGEVGRSQVVWSLRVGELRTAVHGKQSKVWAATDTKGAWAWCRRQGCVMGCTEMREHTKTHTQATVPNVHTKVTPTRTCEQAPTSAHTSTRERAHTTDNTDQGPTPAHAHPTNTPTHPPTHPTTHPPTHPPTHKAICEQSDATAGDTATIEPAVTATASTGNNNRIRNSV
jgi:ribonuclease HI